MSCRTTEIPKVWEGRGETITQTMSERRIGGATGRKDRPGLATDGQLVHFVPKQTNTHFFLACSSIHDLRNS
jgi:hypothetical protein